MKFSRIEPIGFGRFQGQSIEPGQGLTLIHGQNEAGKSTIMAFLELMLYGAKRDNVTRRHYLERYDRYRPWSGAPYEGRLIISLDDERSIELVRRFEKDTESISLLDAVTGKDRTEEFPLDQRGERLFMQELTGMNRRVFIRTACIRQLDLPEGFGNDPKGLSASLLKSLSGARDDESIGAARKKLAEALDEVGKTDNKQEAGELIARIQRLEDEIEEAMDRRDVLSQLKQRVHALEKEHEVADGIVENLRKQQARIRIEELDRDISRAGQLTASIEENREKIRKYEPFRQFPLDNVDTVKEVEQEKTSLLKRSETLKAKIGDFEEELEELRNAFKPYKPFKHFDKDAESTIVELHTRWRNAVDNINALNIQIANEKEKLRDKQSRHGELKDLIEGLGEDASNRLSEISSELDSIEEELQEQLQQIDEEQQQAAPKKRLAGAAAFGSILCSGGAAVAEYIGRYSNDLASSLWMPLVVVAGALVLAAVLVRSAGARSLRKIREAEDKHAGLRDRRSAMSRERSTILSIAGVRNEQEFRDLVTEYRLLDGDLGGSTVLIQQKRLPKLEDEADNLKNRIIEMLKKANIEPRHDDPHQKDISAFREGIRTCRDLQDRFEDKRERYDDLVAEERDVTREIAVCERRLEDMYRGAKVRGFTEFMRHAEDKRSWLKLNEEIERASGRLEDILGDRSIEDMHQERSEYDRHAGSTLEAIEDEPVGISDVESAEENERQLRGQIDEFRGRIESMEADQRDPGILELEKEQCERQLAAIRRRRRGLQTALEILEESAEQMHARIAPLINEAVGNLSRRVTAGRYGGVYLDEEMRMKIRAPETGELIPVDSLSAGARDQVFFAARLALADALAQGRERVPLLLDDSFVEYDSARAGEAFKLLCSVARERQIIFFTCHDREVELARMACGDEARFINLEEIV